MHRMWSPARGRRGHLPHQLFDVGSRPGFFAHRRQHLGRIPVQATGMAERQIGLLQAPGQLGFHRAQLHGVAARLEHGQDALCADLATQAIHGGADGGGVMGEIIVDRDAIHRAAHFHAALDVAELAQGARRGLRGNAHVLGCRDGGQRIELVVHSRKVPVDAAPRTGRAPALRSCAGSPCAREVADRRAETAQLAPATHVQHARQALLQPVHHHAAGGRDGAHQVMELPLDRRQVVEDVGVVVLQVVEHGGARAVVNELAALVEEGGVVLVRLDHEDSCPGPAGLICRSCSARRRPGSRAAGPRAPAPRPASTWWWSCRGCRRRPARAGPAARAATATAGPLV